MHLHLKSAVHGGSSSHLHPLLRLRLQPSQHRLIVVALLLEGWATRWIYIWIHVWSRHLIYCSALY
jgi:hypothetical protein